MRKDKMQKLRKMYKIEKNIPIPPLRRSRASFYKELLSKMAKGDSILVESHGKSHHLAAFCRRLKIKHTTRKEGSKFRFWKM